MGITAVGIEDARTASARPRTERSTHLRRSKIATALAVSALAGIGSYAATYRALILVSQPSQGSGSVVRAPTGGTSTTHAPPAHQFH